MRQTMWRFNAGPSFPKRGLLCIVLRGDWIIYFTDLVLFLFYLVSVNTKSEQFTVRGKIRKLQCMLNTWPRRVNTEVIIKTHIHHLISCCVGSHLNKIFSWDWCWDAELHKVANKLHRHMVCWVPYVPQKANMLTISLCLPGFFTPWVWIKESKQSI